MKKGEMSILSGNDLCTKPYMFREKYCRLILSYIKYIMIFIIKHNNNDIFRIESASYDCWQSEGKNDRSRQTDSSDYQRQSTV